MCRWMGSRFNGWIDYNGVAFSLELLEWDRTFSGFGDQKIQVGRNLKREDFFSSLTNVSTHFRMT